VIPDYLGWAAGDSGACRNIFRNDGTRADDRALTDGDPAQDGGVAADAGLGSHDRRNYLPIKPSLQCAAFGCRARIFVVDENDAMADENLIVDRDAFTDKAMRGNFAVAADARTFLDLDKRADARAVADLTAIEINEVMDFDVAPEFDVRRDYAELSRHENSEYQRAEARASPSSSAV
jgi:hypothetical protein